MATQFNINAFTYTFFDSYTHRYAYTHAISYSRVQSDPHASPQATSSAEGVKMRGKSKHFRL